MVHVFVKINASKWRNLNVKQLTNLKVFTELRNFNIYPCLYQLLRFDTLTGQILLVSEKQIATRDVIYQPANAALICTSGWSK